MDDSAARPRSGLDLDDRAVAEILAALYGIRATALERLNSEHATVRRVLADDGRDLVIKAMSQDHVDARGLRWQAAAIERLDRAGLPVPRMIPSLRGETVCEWQRGRSTILVQLSRRIPGRPLAEVVPANETMRSVGATAARMSVALADHEPPPPGQTHVWELERTATTLQDVQRRIRDAATRRLLDRAAAEFDDRVAPRLHTLPRGVVHHDLNDFNVLVDPESSPPLVSAVLDFGDLVDGVRVAELTTAAAYVSRLVADPLDALVEVARGWLAVAPLTPDEVDVLRPAAIARLAVNLGVWTARRESDRAEYASERVGASAAALDRLLSDDRTGFTERIGHLTGARTALG